MKKTGPTVVYLPQLDRPHIGEGDDSPHLHQCGRSFCVRRRLLSRRLSFVRRQM